MSKNKRLLTVVLGAAALAGLTYSVSRRASARRPAEATAEKGSTDSLKYAAAAGVNLIDGSAVLDGEGLNARDWSRVGVPTPRGSTPDPLDVALDLDGVFDGGSDDDSALTVRPTEHLPLAQSGDDEDAPSADDLGSNWLVNATQSERSLREADLVPEVDNVALADNGDADDDNEEDADAEDERSSRI